MDIALFILFAIILLIVFTGGYIFFAACLRMKEMPWMDPKKLPDDQFAKYTQLIQNSKQWLSEHHAKDAYITGNDGVRLHALWIPAHNAKGTILLAHGYRSSMFFDFGSVFEVYHNLQMNILLPDQRCHGESQGKYITFGVKESQDMQKWIDYHNSELGNFQMIVSGISMGAATIMYLADQVLPKNVKGMIVDCGFTSPAAIISHVFTSTVHLPAVPFIWIADLFARVFAGFSFYQKDSRKTLANSRLPVLMIHGKADDFVPAYMSQQGYDACTSEKKLFMVENAEHGTSYWEEPEQYRQHVIAFLNKHLEGMA